MQNVFTPKERKKAFDILFKEKILPFFEARGFARHTKTSKRLFKTFEQGLSVFVFFEFKNFGNGFYDISIAYFDEEIGDVYDDMYVVLWAKASPTFRGDTADELRAAIDTWLAQLQNHIMPMLASHDSHLALLQSSDSHLLVSEREGVRAIMQKKAETN